MFVNSKINPRRGIPRRGWDQALAIASMIRAERSAASLQTPHYTNATCRLYLIIGLTGNGSGSQSRVLEEEKAHLAHLEQDAPSHFKWCFLVRKTIVLYSFCHNHGTALLRIGMMPFRLPDIFDCNVYTIANDGQTDL